jgi:DUF2934 family protein
MVSPPFEVTARMALWSKIQPPNLSFATDGCLTPVSVSEVRPASVRRCSDRFGWRRTDVSEAQMFTGAPMASTSFGASDAQTIGERKATSRMSHTSPTSMRCDLGRGVTVERRIATAVWNQEERERILALRAHDVFCSRGCEHGFDVADWLRAEQELSSEADDVLLTQSTTGLEISIAERIEQACIVLNMAPSSLLILWTRNEPGDGEQRPVIQHSSLNLVSLPEAVDPEKADVAFREGRVWLHLPFVSQRDSLSEPATAGQN